MDFLKRIISLLCASLPFVSNIDSFAMEKGVEKIVSIQMNSEPISLDPSLAEDGLSYRVFSALREGLLHYDSKYQLIPAVAHHYEVLDKGKCYRFHLSKTKWNDGKFVTAHDFLFSFEKTLNPKTISKLADFFYFIENAKAYKKGELLDFTKVGIKVIDDLTIDFHLTRATPVFLHVLTLPIGFPQRENTSLTNGMFQIADWKRNQSIELNLNPYFENANSLKSKLTKIKFLILPEEAAATALFEKGELDILTRFSHLDEARLSKLGKPWIFPQFAVYYLGFNQKNELLKKRENRVALFNSINQNEVLKAFSNLDRKADDWLSGFLDLKNLSKPKTHPTSKGEKNTLAGKKLTLGFDANSKNKLIAEMVSKQFKESLGLEIELMSRDWKAYVYELSHNTPDIYRFGWMSPFVDAYAALACFYSANPNNYIGWSNAKYDALLDQLATLPLQSPQRLKLAQKAEKILLEEEVMVAPVFHYNQRMITSKNVKNLFVNGLGQIDFAHLEITNK